MPIAEATSLQRVPALYGRGVSQHVLRRASLRTSMMCRSSRGPRANMAKSRESCVSGCTQVVPFPPPVLSFGTPLQRVGLGLVSG